MSVKKNIVANYLGNAWTALMGVIFIPIYIKYLGVEAYGIIGLFTVIQGLLAILDMGLSPTLNREMSRFKTGVHTAQGIGNLLRTIEIIYFSIAFLIGVLMFYSAPDIATKWLNLETMNIEATIQSLQLIGLIIALRWMGILYQSAIRGLQHHVWLNSMMAFMATLRGLGVIFVLIFISPTIEAFFLFQLAISIIEIVVLYTKIKQLLPRVKKAYFSKDSLVSVWHFAAGMTGITILATILTQVDKLILSRLLSLSDFGYFTIALVIASLLSRLIAPLSNVAFPRFTELVASDEKTKLNHEYHKFSQLATITIIPFTLVMSFFSKEIIFIWSQNQNLTDVVAPIMSVWIVGTALNGIMHIPYMAQLAYGWTKLAFNINLSAIAIIIPAFLYFVPLYGVMAAAWIWVLINVGYLLFQITFMHQKILTNEKWEWYINDLLIPSLMPLSVVLVSRLYADYLMINNQYFLFSYIVVIGSLAMVSSILSTPTGRMQMKILYKRYIR